MTLTRVGRHTLDLTNLDKLYWPEDGITKGDLLAFYHRVAPYLLPHLKDRPLSLRRYPDGIHGQSFFQKQAPSHTPDWVRIEPVQTEHRVIEFILCEDAATLLWLANLGCIDQNPWHSRVPTLDQPDYILFDLDPFEPAGLAQAIEVGLILKETLDAIGLRSYPKLSGATGFHVYVPIRPGYNYRAVRMFAEVVGRRLLARHPRLVTMEWSIPKRTGKVFFDHGMNGVGKTVASVYSVRPFPEAPVSVPLRWDEVHTGLSPQDFTITSMPERLGRVGDLFAPVLKGAQALEPAIATLTASL